MFREKVEKDKELIRLEREMGYKEKIYEIDLSIKNIEKTIDKIYMMVSNEKIAKASITGDNNIVITDANGNNITIYRGDEEMLKKSFETLMQQIINLPQEIAELLQKQHASYKNTHSELLLPFLERKFKEDLHPKLLQAGDHADTKLRLERVFMDMYATSDGNIPQEKEIPKFVQSTLMTFGKTHTEECIRHFVLIGNFGYGKSTLTQFLMQVFRAHLIDILRDGLSTKNVKDFLIDYPVYDYPTIEIQRLPLIFPLNEYAGWLAAQKKEQNNHSVLAYIQHEIKKHEKEVKLQTIRDILKTYPLLVVFDGLDEVPSSANRSEVLAEMGYFVENDLFHLQTDVMILVTTRPQSYNNELDDKKYLHLQLTDLSKEDCLEYMRRLLKNSDLTEDKQAENLAILTQAAEDEMIADLMKTPLQATIMEILVRSGGEPPKDRYKLFKNYYETIWKRESQKQSNITINSNNDTHFKEVHKIFGLAVQKLSEDENNPSASFTQAKFKTLITSYQNHIEWNKNVEKNYLEETYIAIVQRIQFIVERGQEEVRFTIRSLQEYFAALAYFNCKEVFFQDRMLAIARNANWRNTFLFGVGYLVNERKYQIEDIFALCYRLNGGEDVPKEQSMEKIGKLGSRLALDILKNGIFNGIGKYENTFASLLEPLLDIAVSENETIAKLPHHIRLAFS